MNEAKKLCPNLICQHVATWREGEENWEYRDDPLVNTDKVSLDPYRLQSRKILAVIKEALPIGLQRVEKASIDEVVSCPPTHLLPRLRSTEMPTNVPCPVPRPVSSSP